MQSGNIQDLFRLQTENVDLKVNMAVNTAIDRVVEQIRGLKEEMHSFKGELRGEMRDLKEELRGEMQGLREELRGEMQGLREELRGEMQGLKEELRGEMHVFRHDVNIRFSSLENRGIAVETKLGIIGEKRKGWYNRFMDQVFKTSWAWLGLVFAYLIVHIK